MGWHGLLFLPCLTGQHGTKNGPQVRAWAEGQARRPMRHGPQGTACLLGPIAIVPCRPVTVPCRAGPARCPGMGNTLNLSAILIKYGTLFFSRNKSVNSIFQRSEKGVPRADVSPDRGWCQMLVIAPNAGAQNCSMLAITFGRDKWRLIAFIPFT